MQFSPRSCARASRKYAYIILTPLKPHFYIVKLGFTGFYIIFLFLLKNIDCDYSLEPPRLGGSKEYPQSMFLSRNMKYIRVFFYLKIFSFWRWNSLYIWIGVFFVMEAPRLHYRFYRELEKKFQNNGWTQDDFWGERFNQLPYLLDVFGKTGLNKQISPKSWTLRLIRVYPICHSANNVSHIHKSLLDEER